MQNRHPPASSASGVAAKAEDVIVPVYGTSYDPCGSRQMDMLACPPGSLSTKIKGTENTEEGMKKLNEAEVKDILRHKEEKTADIRTKMAGLYQELSSEPDTDILSAAAVSSPGLSGLPCAKGGAHKDLNNILEKYSHMRRERSRAVREMMSALMAAEDRINRVWACFYALGTPYFAILKALYVDSQLYQAVEQEFAVSHKTFEKYRRDGIQLVIKYYESDESTANLLHWHDGDGQRKKPKAGPQEKKGYAQCSLLDYLSLPAQEEGTEKTEKETDEK